MIKNTHEAYGSSDWAPGFMAEMGGHVYTMVSPVLNQFYSSGKEKDTVEGKKLT